MDTTVQGVTASGAENTQGRTEPKSLQIADKGINSSRDFRNFMSAIMSDVVAGRLTASMTNAACNAGGKLLKMVELEQKYATSPEQPRRVLTVAFETPQLPPGEEVAVVES